MTAQTPEIDGYEGVTHSGLAVVSVDGLSVLFAQRSFDETDDPQVAESWEFPGGGLDEGEDPMTGAAREFGEEIGFPLPEGQVVNGWRSDDGVYQGFVYRLSDELDLTDWTPTEEVKAVEWRTREMIENASDLRPEVAEQTDWDMIFEESSMADDPADDAEPEYSADSFDLDGPIPVHGVIAPEEMPSGDKRAFSKGAMTRRPLAIPLRDTSTDIGGHDGAFMAGRVDRMMRKDGLIHYEGSLMPSKAEGLVEKMQFMDGSFGVSVDGDQGSMDAERTEATNTLWFDTIRAAGLTAVDIPAFHEAHVRFGLHPHMPNDEALTASAFDSGDYVGAPSQALVASIERFKRGPGWVTDPKATNRIHDYWTKKGQPGYAKVAWGTNGDFTRAKKLIGAKIAEHSPDKMRFLNQIIAQWHFDALGYWPGDLGKPGNAPDTAENRRRAATHAASLTDQEFTDEVTALMTKGLDRDDIETTEGEESIWEAVLVSSAVSGNRARPPIDYFHQHPTMKTDPWEAPSAAFVVEEPDTLGFKRVWGYAGEWGICHVGMDGRCVEPPRSGSDDYPDFHLGRTKTDDGYVYTGVLTYGVGHRDAETILSESPEQAMFDNIKNAWAAVRVGENDRGIWFSGVVLPKVDEDDLVKIEASGQVSGEWLAGEMRACLTVNVPGFPNRRASAAYDDNGNVLALAASAFGGVDDAPCNKPDDPIGDLTTEVWARIEARQRFVGLQQKFADAEFARLQRRYEKEK